MSQLITSTIYRFNCSGVLQLKLFHVMMSSVLREHRSVVTHTCVEAKIIPLFPSLATCLNNTSTMSSLNQKALWQVLHQHWGRAAVLEGRGVWCCPCTTMTTMTMTTMTMTMAAVGLRLAARLKKERRTTKTNVPFKIICFDLSYMGQKQRLQMPDDAKIGIWHFRLSFMVCLGMY